MTRIAVSPKADADIEGILERLTDLAGSTVADRYAAQLEAIYERLAMFPAIGPRRPRLGRHARIVVLAPYVVVNDYLRGQDAVRIVRILDGRRNITRRFVRH